LGVVARNRNEKRENQNVWKNTREQFAPPKKKKVLWGDFLVVDGGGERGPQQEEGGTLILTLRKGKQRPFEGLG